MVHRGQRQQTIGRISAAERSPRISGAGTADPAGSRPARTARCRHRDGNNAMGRITTAGAVSNSPSAASSPARTRTTAGPDGALSSPRSATSSIGRITTCGAVSKYTAQPRTTAFGITGGPDGALWFTNNSDQRSGGSPPAARSPNSPFRRRTAIPPSLPAAPTARCGSPRPGHRSDRPHYDEQRRAQVHRADARRSAAGHHGGA